MLHVHSSNQLELLLDQLDATTTSAADGDPLAPAQIIVQNQGMARWASQQLALKQGVSANILFQTPKVA